MFSKIVQLLNNVSEAKQVGTLYHFTFPYNTLRILESNKINKSNNKYYRGYTSLTRDRYFKGVGQIPVFGFVIDGDKLSNHYKIEPFAFKTFTKGSGDFEAEERILGDLDNLKDYLKGIVINKKVLNTAIEFNIDRGSLISYFHTDKNISTKELYNKVIETIKSSGFKITYI